MEDTSENKYPIRIQMRQRLLEVRDLHLQDCQPNPGAVRHMSSNHQMGLHLHRAYTKDAIEAPKIDVHKQDLEVIKRTKKRHLEYRGYWKNPIRVNRYQ